MRRALAAAARLLAAVLRRTVSARHALIFLVVACIGLTAAVFTATSNEVNRIRGDFCTWTTQHYQTDLSQPQTRVRKADERSDEQLERKLGCQP